MENIKMKLTGSETLLDGGTILLFIWVSDIKEPLTLKLDRYLGTGTPDHLYLGGRCLKPYCETEKRIIDALNVHLCVICTDACLLDQITMEEAISRKKGEMQHYGAAKAIVEACRKEGRVAPFGFDDRDHYNTTDTLVGAVALLIGKAISKGKPLEKIDKVYAKLEELFRMGKKKKKRRKKK